MPFETAARLKMVHMASLQAGLRTIDLAAVYMQAGLERYEDTMWSWKGDPVVFWEGDKFPREVQDRIISSSILTEAISEDIEKLAALGFMEYLRVDYGDDHIHVQFKSCAARNAKAHLWIADNIHWYITINGGASRWGPDAFSRNHPEYMRWLTAAKKMRAERVAQIFALLPQPIAEEISDWLPL